MEKQMERAPKAYKNTEFLKSNVARELRILAEYMEPKHRFEQEGVQHTVVFFGSARIKPDSPEAPTATGKYFHAAEEFAFQLANWSKELKASSTSFNICSGGGPGIMEAANKGANRAKCSSIGLNVSLPFEQRPNPYISEELNFEFHYFFMRKLWFLYHAKALIVFPGGFGTFDELFETLTLIQTQKMDKGGMEVLLYDRSFWESMVDFKKWAEYGLISEKDLDLFHYFNSPSEGIDYLKPRLLKIMNRYND